MKKDMHMHTSFSDGQYFPEEILKKIGEAGITEFAITDHDNIDGAIKMQKLVENLNVKFHVGVEISSRITELGLNVHLLCYDFDVHNKKVLQIIDELKQKRIHKLDLMIDFVEKHFGYRITEEEKQKLIEENNVVGKPHICAFLSTKINFETESFYKVMNGFKSADFKVDAKKVINAFHDAGGVVVLAHPIEIEDEYKIDSFPAIKFLKDKGLDGLETHHTKHSKKDIQRFSVIAKNLNLFESFGSDFHGEKIKPNIKLGMSEKPENLVK